MPDPGTSRISGTLLARPRLRRRPAPNLLSHELMALFGRDRDEGTWPPVSGWSSARPAACGAASLPRAWSCTRARCSTVAARWAEARRRRAARSPQRQRRRARIGARLTGPCRSPPRPPDSAPHAGNLAETVDGAGQDEHFAAAPIAASRRPICSRFQLDALVNLLAIIEGPTNDRDRGEGAGGGARRLVPDQRLRDGDLALRRSCQPYGERRRATRCPSSGRGRDVRRLWCAVRAEEALEVFQALRIAGFTGPALLDRHGRLHAAAPAFAFAFARVRRILPSPTGSPYRVSSWAPTHRPISGTAPVGGVAGRVRSALPITTKRASLRAR